MRKPCAALAAGLLLGLMPAGTGAAQVEIVVTGSRLTDYDPYETPYVALTKRADNLVTEVKVVCDTRDESQRHEELRATLRGMIAAAKRDEKLDLGIGREIVGSFDETMLDSVIRPDTKVETSYAVVLVKTPVGAADTFDSATARITDYIARTPKTGRTEILRQNDWQLTLIEPEQYRGEVIKLVAEDAKRSAAILGAGYRPRFEGLNLPIAWYRVGPLDLGLYIPYRQEFLPPDGTGE